MDFIAHTLTGYALGRAGLNRMCPHASAILLLAANAPDADLLSLAGGDQLMLEYHRGVTHSIVGIPFVALVPLIVVAVFARGGMLWRRGWAVSMIGVASHVLLDWTNVYGVRLLSPISNRWYHLDIVGMTDIAIWGILLFAAGWVALARLVSHEIGTRGTNGRGVAVSALAVLSACLGARWLLHERALSTLDSHLYGTTVPLRVAAFPHYVDPFRWRGLVETDEVYHLFEMNLRNDLFDPSRGLRLYKPPSSEALRTARQAEPFEAFLEFARFPLWRMVSSGEADGAFEVQVLDLSFALPEEDRFAATAIVDGNQRVLRSWFQYAPPGTVAVLH